MDFKGCVGVVCEEWTRDRCMCSPSIDSRYMYARGLCYFKVFYNHGTILITVHAFCDTTCDALSCL